MTRPRSRLHAGLLVLALLNMVPAVEAESSWGLWSLAAASAVLSWLLARPSGGTRLPRGLIYLGVFGAIGYLVWEMFGAHEEQTVYILDLAHFMILLACCKFFELYTYRDMSVIVLIAFLLMTIGGFVSSSPLFALVLLIDVTFGVAWLAAFQSRREIDVINRRRRAAAAWDEADAVWPVPVGGVSSRGYYRVTAPLSMGLVALTALVFVFLPRGWGRGIFGRMHRMIPAAVTGCSDEIQLGQPRIFEDPSPVMSVRFLRGGRPIDGDDFTPYLRAYTFDRYSQGRWQRTHAPVPRLQRLSELPRPAALSAADRLLSSDQVIEQQVTLNRLEKGMIFALYPPVAFGSPDLWRLAQDPEDLALFSEDVRAGPVNYVVRSAAGYSPAVQALLDLPVEKKWRFRDAPSFNPEIREFARRFFRRYGDPSEPAQYEHLVTKLRDFLASSGEFEYTLVPGEPPPDVDPVKHFLVEHRRGHCEYFASAMVLMCQAVNIPARLVTGYCGGEYDPQAGTYQFRRRNAHAWVEVYLPGRGWTTFDPSPLPESRRPDRRPGLWAKTKQMLDALHFRWTTLVVSFDTRLRHDLAARFLRWYESIDRSPDRSPSFVELLSALAWGPEGLSPLQRALYWLVLALCSAFVILSLRALWIVYLMLRAYLPRRRRPAVSVVRRPEARFYDRLLSLLANRGYSKPPHLTPREFARSLASVSRDLADLPQFTEWFYETQYGARPLSRDRLARLREFLQRLREDVAFGRH